MSSDIGLRKIDGFAYLGGAVFPKNRSCGIELAFVDGCTNDGSVSVLRGLNTDIRLFNSCIDQCIGCSLRVIA